MAHVECRELVFRERGSEVLSSVVQGTQIAQADPFDVEQIHGDARAAFNATLAQVRAEPTSRILLVRGEAGCGKTHLIRSLRARTHNLHHGVVAYVHMTSEKSEYTQYLLRQVVRSLSDPYLSQPQQPARVSALDLLSDALVRCGSFEPAAVEALRDAEDDLLAERVTELADRLIEAAGPDGVPRFADVDVNTLRVLLYRQSSRKSIQRRVGGFLNGEPLSDLDWQKISALPRDCERTPIHQLSQLARVTWASLNAPLILCVDQIEASDITANDHEPFLRAMAAACELIEQAPRLLVLLSCLDSAYDAHALQLIASYRHRIENDPEPVILAAARSEHEVRQILSRRLKWLYEREGLAHIPPDSVFPLEEDVPHRLSRQHIRTVLQQVQAYWARCRSTDLGMLPPWDDPLPPGPQRPEDDGVDRLRIAWNEFQTSGNQQVAEDDAEQMDLLAWALRESMVERSEPASLVVQTESAGEGRSSPRMLSIVLDAGHHAPIRLLAGLCDKDPRGNGLFNQLEAMEQKRDGTAQSPRDPAPAFAPGVSVLSGDPDSFAQ